MTADTYLLLAEVARETRTTVSTVRYWITSGKLPSVRPGRRRLVRRTDLDAFLASSATPTRSVVTGGRQEGDDS